MIRRVPYLQYLPAFDAVARCGSVRTAAEQLNLSPGAVSLQIKKLSDSIGVPLFERSGRALRLSSAGKSFAHSVSSCLDQVEAAERVARESALSDEPAILRVSIPTGLGVAWLSAALISFAQERGVPELTINESITAREVDWQNNDVAVVYGNPPFPGVRWELLYNVKLRTVCSPTLFPFLELQRRNHTLRGITLLHEDDGSEWDRWAMAARTRLEGSQFVKVGSLAQAVASATQGKGIALASDILTRTLHREGRLIQPFSTTIKAAGSYYILFPNDRGLSTRMTSLLQDLIGYLASKPD
ncbi:LysR family transcriptional regulator [uncultured Nitratireductor sp.]|uniref:LysR family transcriptional regulator n=1 Tax=uncultured Nitratireductor sp. TaxID=520953 RepID=UPI0025E350AB|nr:LysR family transcriptional regulator [uncultured Nitratireductor sp.]